MTIKLIDHNRGNEREMDSVSEAEEKKQNLIELGADPEKLEIVHDESESESSDESENGDEETQSAPVKPRDDGGETTVDHADTLPQNQPVGEDPLKWIPDEFQDTIDGTIAINRKGFEVLAHHYNISCETDMIEQSSQSVIHKAKATADNGQIYTAYGESHASEDKKTQLVRLSDTRAFKRAISRATGVGMIAVHELKNEL